MYVPLRYALGAALLLLFAGCDLMTYEPHGRYDVDIEPPVAYMSLDFTGAPDTLAVWEGVRLSYAADLDGRPFHHAVLTVGSITLTSEVAGTPFELDTRTLSNGYHEAVLRVFARSGSGSMADRLGAEGFLIETRRTLFVRNGPPPALQHVRTRIRDGKLVVSWEPSPFLGTEKVQISKYVQLPEYGSNWVGFSTNDVADPLASEWVDPSETVGPLRYDLVLYTKGRSSDIVRLYLDNTAPFAAQVSTDEGTRVAWHPPPLVPSFRRYVIERFDGFTPTDWQVFTQRTDTAFVIPGLRFGDRMRLRMRLEGPMGDTWRSPELLVVGPGERAPFTPDAGWAGAFWDFYHTRTLRRFDPVTRQQRSFTSPHEHAWFEPSQDASEPRVLGIEEDGAMHLLDAETLAPVWTGTFADFGLRASDTHGQLFRLLDARTAVVALESGHFYRLDLPAGTVTGSIAQRYTPFEYTVTPDGRYVLNVTEDRLHVYAFDAQVPLQTSINPNTCPTYGIKGYRRTAIVLKAEEVAMVCERHIEVRSLPEMKLLRAYALPMFFAGISGDLAYGYDEPTRRFVWLDLRTGAEQSAPLAREGSPYHIRGAYVVDSEGVYVPLLSLQ